MDVFSQIVVKIIKAQEAIIGPVALERAEQVPHLQINWKEEAVSIEGNKSQAVDDLVSAYQELFGQISREVSKEAAAPLLGQLPSDQMPEALK